jgi:hypothetical protein
MRRIQKFAMSGEPLALGNQKQKTLSQYNIHNVLILVESTEVSDFATSFWLGSAALMCDFSWLRRRIRKTHQFCEMAGIGSP